MRNSDMQMHEILARAERIKHNRILKKRIAALLYTLLFVLMIACC